MHPPTVMAFIAELAGGCAGGGACPNTLTVNAKTLAAHTPAQILVPIVLPPGGVSKTPAQDATRIPPVRSLISYGSGRQFQLGLRE